MATGDDLELVLETTAMAVGGAAIAREPSGRVVFVEGALSGERVRARLTEVHRDYARARISEVLRAASERVEPPCPELARGCGGCDLQHLAADAQAPVKAVVVADALRRTAGVVEPSVRIAPCRPSSGYRTTVRAGVRDGRAGLRRRRSHELVTVESCLVAHPLVEELLVDGFFGDAVEVTIRVGAATGERLVLVTPSASGVVVPDDVIVVGSEELRRGRQVWIHEEVDGRRFRVSARSFFQSSREGAEALVAAVREAACELDPTGGAVVDAYAGVGLFAATVGAGLDRPVLALEWSRSSVADARHNLRDLPAQVLRTDVAAWEPQEASLVIADPSRAGLGRDAVEVLAGTGAPRLILVSCDVGALGRDVRLLIEAGFVLSDVVVVDLFPYTHHVEVVCRFDR
ncbi:MAG: TRAM domain-containing protein [Acidimicrobiales bacterium]